VGKKREKEKKEEKLDTVCGESCLSEVVNYKSCEKKHRVLTDRGGNGGQLATKRGLNYGTAATTGEGSVD